MSWKKRAIEKLEAEQKTAQYDKYAQIMKDSVLKALTDFCGQDEEFAQAVAQGGSFEDCMKAVAQKCGTGLSDLEAYSRAARFYFPGAGVRFQMSLDLCGDARKPESKPKTVRLDLSDFW